MGRMLSSFSPGTGFGPYLFFVRAMKILRNGSPRERNLPRKIGWRYNR